MGLGPRFTAFPFAAPEMSAGEGPGTLSDEWSVVLFAWPWPWGLSTALNQIGVNHFQSPQLGNVGVVRRSRRMSWNVTSVPSPTGYRRSVHATRLRLASRRRDVYAGCHAAGLINPCHTRFRRLRPYKGPMKACQNRTSRGLKSCNTGLVCSSSVMRSWYSLIS